MTNIYMNGEVGTVPGAPEPGRPARGGRSRRRVAALVVACALVAGGGAFAVEQAVASPASAGTSLAASPAASGLTGQAATLNSVLTDASSASSAAAVTGTRTGATARRVARRRLRRALVRLRRLGGMHGQFTFRTKKGPRTLAFERGTVSAIAGSDVTVRAGDGTMWTWVLTGTSVVRENGARAAVTGLAFGERVFAAGPVTGSVRDARLIVIRKAK